MFCSDERVKAYMAYGMIDGMRAVSVGRMIAIDKIYMSNLRSSTFLFPPILSKPSGHEH